jgi:hypothetical protein
MSMLALTGIAAGVGAALFQSLSYLFSRRFLHRHPEGILPLLTFSHLMMGAASLVALPFLWRGGMPLHPAVIGPLLGTAGFYLLGQAGLFWALRRVDSSRIAPMLGLKILVLALIVTLWQGHALGLPRWIAVVMSAGAAFLLNEAGGRIPWSSIAGLAVAITGYSLSDIHIASLVRALAPAGPVAPFLGVALSYLLCGVLCLPLLRVTGRGSRTVWRKAAPHAACWFAAMFLLYVCFDAIGVVFGNIVQALRGLISISLGVMVVRAGWTHLETRLPRHVFWKRLAGASLMLGAIALYALQAR